MAAVQREALAGLGVLFRENPQQGFQRGRIQEYDAAHDCFIVWSEDTSQHVAIQFRQFVVEQDSAGTGQLLLRVPCCTRRQLPALYYSAASGPNQSQAEAAAGSSAQSSSHGSSFITPQGSQQLSAVLSQQLSGLIGRCFSHTEEGFEVASHDQLAQAAAAMSSEQRQQQQQVGMPIHRPSRHSTDSGLDDGSYWGSPVKHDGSAAIAAAAALAAAAAAGAAPAAGGGSAGGRSPEQQQANDSAAGSTPPVHIAAAAAAAAPGGGLSSFQEISRMISQSEDSSPMARPGTIKTSLAPGHAARLLDEQGSWGTPQENSPWGTPREQQLGSNATNTPTSSNAEQPTGQHHASGSALHKLVFGGEQLHSRLEAVVSAEPTPPQQQAEQQPGYGSQSVAPGDVLGGSKGAAAKQAAPAEAAAMDLEPAEAVAAAVAAVDAAAGAEADTFDEMDMDFSIPVAMDVQPRPLSRNSSRFREMYRAGSASGSTGMPVDVPQPLSARHGNMLRSPGRSLPAPSDPGHIGLTSAFSNAANMAAAQVSASAGGAGAFEQRRTSTNIGPGLGSFGNSHAASRRMSRNASSRLNADQDWALLGPDGQSLQPSLNGVPPQQQQQQQQRVSLGQVLHQAPGVANRRASRTLSGRLALDQDVGAVLMEQLDDAEPDVLSRPVAPAAPGLDTIVSRRQSTSNGRGTPDSDGFGFSEFEGLEPLVPPEEAAAAALTEAAAAAAAATETAALGDGGSAGGAAGGLHHHRAHRRSARSLGVHPVVNMSQRPSMRLSDQDPGHHALAALPAMTAQAVAAAAAARAHAGASASGLPGPRTGSYDVIVPQAPLQPTEEEAMEVDQEEEPAPAADSSSAPGARTPPAAGLSRRSSRANSGGATAAGSPRQSGTAASTRSASGSMNDGSRRSSKRSIPSIFQAAAAVAAAAEAAAAAAVGFALGGKDRTASEQQQQPMDVSPALPVDEVATQQQQQQAEQLREDSVTANSFLRQRLAGDGLGSGFGSVDSFTCPAFMPLAGSITATGGRPSSSANGSAGSSSNGSMQQGSTMPGVGNTPAAPVAAALPAHTAAMAAAAMAAEGDGGMRGLYGSPAANLGSYVGGSPSAAQAALLRRQQLVSSEGSDWGSGALGSHLHLSTSGIDSPTGSAVFRLGGNSPHPLDTCDSAGGGGASVPSGELSAALESLAVQTGCSTGGSKPIGIGASRMAREAAAAAAGGCNGSTGPVGAAALLVGTRGLTGLGVKGSPGLSEITPAAADDDPGEDRIGAKYPSDSGTNQPAGAVFFRLAGDLAPGVTKIASPGSEVVVGEQQPGRRSSSSGGGAAVSKVLGKVLIGPAGLLTRPPRQSDSTGSGEGGQGAAAGAAVAVASSRGASTTSDAAPPSYAESVGAETGDESSPHANPFAAIGRRVWPAHVAAAAQAGVSAGAEAPAAAVVGLSSDVRQSARLGAAAAAAPLAGAGACADAAPAQQQDSDAGAQPPSTGLVRRMPHASRAPSQSLQLGLLGGSSFHYGDECDDQTLMRGGAVSSAGQGPRTLLEDRRTTGRVVLHAFASLSAQWFDSMALVVLGPQLASAMLPAGMPQLQQLQRLFGIFALGHVLQLLGCFLWPAQAAKLWHKGLLAWTLGLSGFCTALSACMPSYSEGGAVGLAVITVLRFIAGAAPSNDAAAGLVYLWEHAPQCPNLHASLVPAAMAAGACGASGLALVLSWVMGPAVLGASGWRVVLVLSLLSNAMVAGLRGWVLQQPEGQMQAAELMDRSNTHVGRILRQHAPEVLLAVLLQAFATSGLFLLAAWLPSYLMQATGMATSTTLLVHTTNMALLAGSMLLGGLLADEWAPTPVLLATCAVAIAFGWPAWLLFSMGVAEVTWFAQAVLCVLVGLHWGALTEVTVEMFPAGMRTSALTVVHTLSMVALGSTAPLMALGFLAQSGSPASPAFVNIIMAAVTAAAVAWQAWRSSARLRF